MYFNEQTMTARPRYIYICIPRCSLAEKFNNTVLLLSLSLPPSLSAGSSYSQVVPWLEKREEGPATKRIASARDKLNVRGPTQRK